MVTVAKSFEAPIKCKPLKKKRECNLKLLFLSHHSLAAFYLLVFSCLSSSQWMESFSCCIKRVEDVYMYFSDAFIIIFSAIVILFLSLN